MQIVKKLILVIFLLVAAGCTAEQTEANFQTYWSKFRSACLADDYTTLATLTKFPLEVKGVDDSISIKKFEKSQLDKIFPKVMSQTIFQHQENDVIETRLREVVKKKEKVDFTPTDKNIRIEQFEFELVNGTWLLVRAYLEE